MGDEANVKRKRFFINGDEAERKFNLRFLGDSLTFSRNELQESSRKRFPGGKMAYFSWNPGFLRVKHRFASYFIVNKEICFESLQVQCEKFSST